MLRFRLGSIPVEVHPSHLLVSVALGLTFQPRLNSQDPSYYGQVFTHVLSWVVIVFVSVLVHELGHALASRAFGYRPSIALVWLGGHTQPNAPGPIPWHRDVLLTFAGPLFGLLLAVAAWGLRNAVAGQSPGAYAFFNWMMIANISWTVLNLMPVLPLDGGRISTALAMRLFGPRGFLVAQGFAVLVSMGVVALAIMVNQTFVAIFFALYGFQALRMMVDAFRATPGDEMTGPHAQTLAQARAALDAGQLEDARRLGVSVLEASEPAGQDAESRAHHLLGWVALKEGKGRTALDHFSQVHRRPVEPHALAAAFSLIGDDGRAVGYWELAWREGGNRTVLHEFAGTLIRLGKVNEALRLPGVEPAAAFTCAERVLFIRGAYSEAAALGEQALQHAPDATIAYDAACAFARARNVSDAVRLLRRASALGFRDAAYAASDEDLAPLHGHPAFESWLTELRESPAS
jgi:Zn-dependent protease